MQLGFASTGCLMLLLLIGCNRNDTRESVSADAYAAAAELAERLPPYAVSPSAATRPWLAGETRFAPPTPAGADRFSYQFVETEAGELLIHKTGGIAGVSEWCGPVPEAELPNVTRIKAAAARERERREW